MRQLPIPCPCGSGRSYADCCQPYVSGQGQSPTAEACMRSRYTAYALGEYEHLQRTAHPRLAKDFDPQVMRDKPLAIQWQGLTVEEVDQGGVADLQGRVVFRVRFAVDGQVQTLREESDFRRQADAPDGPWLYTAGRTLPEATVRREAPKTGRNDPCPCGSGRKFKKCCGA